VDGPKSVVANFSAQQASNTTTLVSSLNPSIAGQLVTFTATVAPSAGTTVPTGTASFIDGSTTLSTVGLDASGQAEYSTSGLALGSHQITVQYSGDANFTSSSSTTLTQVVNTYVPVTLTVSSLADDNTPGTLRSAIGAAHTGDTISFSVSGTITLTQGELDIEKDLIISGPGAANLTISGNNASRVFLLDSGVTANITGITISSGNSNGSPNGALGGGILIDAATLMVNNSTFSGNFANYGGGIYNAGGSVTVTNSTFSGNSATAVGAGFLNQGTVNVTNNTFFNNFANYGGGIYNGQTATVTNSTFVGNYGQSIYNEGMITLKNTILANSGSGSAGIPLGNCVNNSTFISDGHNLSDDPSCSSFFTATGDLNNTPAGFDPRGFQDYGGPTFTLALQSTSPAVDAIPLSPTNDCMDSTGNPITTDQRGVARPQGAACDIGAYELDRVLTLPTLVSSTNPSVAGAAVTFTATVSPRSGSGTPTGIVTFYDGATNIGGAPLNGSSKASLNNSGLSSGTHSITAVYSGDAAFAASTSAPLTQIVKAASSISVGSSLNPSAYGQSVTFTATVTHLEEFPPVL
jgi:hypothetical protein